MEDVFSTLLPLIPLALLIAVRMVADKKKREAAEDRKKLASTLVQVVEAPFKPTGGAVPEGEFSAHSLRPDEEEAPRPAAPRLEAPRPKRKVHSLLPQTEIPSAAAPMDLGAPPRPDRPQEASLDAKTVPVSGAAAGFYLDRLPPLKRAVVFSEILGSPKSLGAD